MSINKQVDNPQDKRMQSEGRDMTTLLALDLGTTTGWAFCESHADGGPSTINHRQWDRVLSKRSLLRRRHAVLAL